MAKFGLSVALLTPFAQNGQIDAARLGSHARTMLLDGADGVTLFGTTGEGASIAAQERITGIQALLAAGCPAAKVVLGICATSVGDAASQIAEGRRHGITEFLLLPPFYFKGSSDDGLFDWHVSLLEGTEPDTRFILYHIPQVSGVGIPVDLVGRLAAAAPGRVHAIKDSSGSWDNARALLELGVLTVLVGDERLLHRAMAHGAGGAISGMANLYPARMKRIVDTATEDRALSAEVTRVVSGPVIPALKAIMAQRSGDAGWERLRPPLMRLDAVARSAVLSSLQQDAT